jgi:hypothetical protein
MYQGVVDRAMAKQGLEGEDLQAFYAHCRESKGPELRNALQLLVHTRDVSGFKSLASAYWTTKVRGGQ